MFGPSPPQYRKLVKWTLAGLFSLMAFKVACDFCFPVCRLDPNNDTRYLVKSLDDATLDLMRKRNVTPPPTYLLLAWNYEAFLGEVLHPDADQRGPVKDLWLQELAKESDQYLRSMFPEWDPSPMRKGRPAHNGLPVGDDGAVVLSGGQVLLFLLGGYSGNGDRNYDSEMAGHGFAVDPRSPFGDADKGKPEKFERGNPCFRWMELNKSWIFESQAWKWDSKDRRITWIRFPGFCEWTGVPIAYIRDPSLGVKSPGFCVLGLGKLSTKRTAMMEVSPVLDESGTFVNSGRFQIIAAGQGGRNFEERGHSSPFGSGGVWWPRSFWKQAPVGYRSGEPGHDDIANFWPKPLGESK